MKILFIRMDGDLHQKLRLLAARRKLSLTQLVTDILTQYCTRHKSEINGQG